MTSVFLLVPDLLPCGELAPVRLLASGLPRERFHVTLGILGPADVPAVEALRAAGVTVQLLPIRHFLDVTGAWRLRQVIGEANPAVIHAWGPIAVRLARLVVSQGDACNVPRLVVSAAAAPVSGFGGWLSTRMIRRADRVIATTWGEAERYRRLQVPADRLTRVAPAAMPLAPEAHREVLCRKLGVPPDSRLVITGGRTELGVGPREAIIAFDMLRYESPELHLVVFGAGSEATALEQFGRALAFDDFRIRVMAHDGERAEAVRLAEAVWVTRTFGGTDEALEAMTAGKPVVGWQTADLVEIIEDGTSGFVVPPGDRAALAAKARLLLVDPDGASRMGAAGRVRAAEHFGLPRMVEQFTRIYAELAAG